MRLVRYVGVALLVLLLCGAMALAQTTKQTEMVPSGKGFGVPANTGASNAAKPARRTSCPNGICYHGGPIMAGTVPIYIIWYGNWNAGGSNSATSQSLVEKFITNLSGSPYEHINTTYCQNSTCPSSVNVSGNLSQPASATDSSYDFGTALSDANIQSIVAKYCAGLGGCSNGALYFVLTSSDVNESSGFCTQYCGWHTHGTISGSDVKYAFVGNPDRCPSACEAQTTSPNNDSGADGMISIVAHEQEEAISDPDLNAWYDRTGAENADKCAWTFGTESTAGNGSLYNITLNGTEYLIQQNWLNASGGLCTMSH